MTAFLVNIVAPVFYKLLYMSITALVVGVIIMQTRRFADKYFSPFWKYAMWALVLVALVVPWRPQSIFAVLNNTEKLQEVSFRKEYVEAQAEYEVFKQYKFGDYSTEPLSSEVDAKNKMETLHLKTLIFDSGLPALWLGGTVIIGLFMIVSGLRLGRKIRNSAIPSKTGRYEAIVQSCKNKLGMNRQVGIVIQSYVKSPALFGLFRPKIILPEYADSLSDRHLEYVIHHELSHLKRGDSIINTLLLALQTVYWFNPLTWLLFKFIREDMELANDAAVLKDMEAEEQKEYSLSLVEVLAGTGKPALAPRMLCMVDSEKNMARRINMIKLGEFFKRRKWVIAISGLLVIAVTATLFLTVGAVNADKYKIEITSEIVDKVDRISQGHYQSTDSNIDFVITASKIHGAYRQNDKTKVFATTLYSRYVLGENKIMEVGAGTVPVSITYSEPTPGQYVILDYTEAQDGSYFKPSIENFCKLPSGKKIKGLASEIMSYYGDNGELDMLKQQKLNEYLDGRGLSGYTIQNNASYDMLPDDVTQALWKNETPYIGENSKVGALIVALNDPPYMTANGFRLSTSEKPYGLTIQYVDETAVFDTNIHDPENNQGAFKFRALILLCLIDNADFVRYEFSYGQTPTGSLEYTREWADTTVHENIKDFTKDYETFKKFVNGIYSKYLSITDYSNEVKPGIQVKIEDYYGEADDALEEIYEDAHYKYSLSSIRSDKIMLTFENADSPLFGQRISLKESIAKKHISMEDLILNGLQLWMEPKNNPMGGYFNIPSHLHKFYIGESEIFPSNMFMYTAERNGLNSYFAVDELISYIEACGYKAEAKQIKAQWPLSSARYIIEGKDYVSEIALQSFGVNVKIGWELSSHTPVWFSFADSSGTTYSAKSNTQSKVETNF